MAYTMGSSSVPMHRGLVPWQGILLGVSLVTFWSLPSTAQLSIVSTHCTKGEDVILRICNKPPEAIAYVWYKGKGVDKNNIIAFFVMTSSFNVRGPQYNGEEMITNDGSLLLKKVTMMDTGMYTVVAHFPDSKTEIGFGQLDVYEHLRVPMLIASKYGLKNYEGSMLLACFTNGLSVQWQFNGTDLKVTDRMELSKDGRRIGIYRMRREHVGVYKCNASNPIMWAESQPVHLNMEY